MTDTSPPRCVCGATMVKGDDEKWTCPQMEAELEVYIEKIKEQFRNHRMYHGEKHG